MINSKVCLVRNCNILTNHSVQLCEKHRRFFKKRLKINFNEKCLFHFCSNKTFHNFFCTRHFDYLTTNSFDTKAKCIFLNCERYEHSSSYCQKHYGSFNYYRKKYNIEKLKYCKVQNCFNYRCSEELCSHHLNFLTLHNLKISYDPKNYYLKCKNKYCNEKIHAKGFCEKHYGKLRNK